MKRFAFIFILFVLMLSGCSGGYNYIKLGETRNLSGDNVIYQCTYRTSGDMDIAVVTVQNNQDCRVRLKDCSIILEKKPEAKENIEVECIRAFQSLDVNQVGFILYKWKHSESVSGIKVSVSAQPTYRPIGNFVTGMCKLSTDGIHFEVTNTESYVQNFLRAFLVSYDSEGVCDIIHYDIHHLESGVRKEIVIPLTELERRGITEGITGIRVVGEY